MQNGTIKKCCCNVECGMFRTTINKNRLYVIVRKYLDDPIGDPFLGKDFPGNNIIINDLEYEIHRVPNENGKHRTQKPKA